MATLGTAYYRSEVVLNDCRREYVRRSYQDELGGRNAAWAARKQAASAAQAAHTDQQTARQHHPAAVPKNELMGAPQVDANAAKAGQK